MEINYGSSFFTNPFLLANRHFQVAFARMDQDFIQDLWDNQIIKFVDPESPLSLSGRVKHFVLGVLEYIPVINLVIAIADRIFNRIENLPPNLSDDLKEAILYTPQFDSYRFEENKNVHISDLTKRPANLLYKGIFGNDISTKPGSKKFLTFFPSIFAAKKHIQWQSNNKVVDITAKNETAHLYKRAGYKKVDCGEKDLTKYFGKNVFQISFGEIKKLLNSQRIWISPLLPKNFYLGMKDALKKDGILILPGKDSNPLTIEKVLKTEYPSPSWSQKIIGIEKNEKNSSLYYFQSFLKEVQKNPKKYGFDKNKAQFSFEALKPLTLYQIGSLVLKSEDYYSLVEDGYSLADRKVGDQDQIRLISASGIRGFYDTQKIPGNGKHQIDYKIIKSTFKTAFQAAGKNGYFILCGIGMGIWGGDPEIYWKAFFDACIEEKNFPEAIFVNPAHQKTQSGFYKGYIGSEFALLLEKYLQKYPHHTNLKKIVNLFDKKPDLFLLARNIKKAVPDKTVALLNASDPDVTIGYCVGEYVNHLCLSSTTEENFTALGTNGLCFEEMTGVLQDSSRIIQAQG